MTEDQIKNARHLANLWNRDFFALRNSHRERLYGEILLASSMQIVDMMRCWIDHDKTFDLKLIDNVLRIIALDVYRQLAGTCPERVTQDVHDRIAEMELEREQMEQLINETGGHA